MVRGVSDMGERYIKKYGEDDFERLLTVFILSLYHKRLEM
jgi:hypothetical protein